MIAYGELKMPNEAHADGVFYPDVGTRVKAGDKVGIVGRALKDGKLIANIRHHNTAMLHIELHKESYRIDGWKLDGDRDPRLLDPTPYLKLKTVKFKSNA